MKKTGCDQKYLIDQSKVQKIAVKDKEASELVVPGIVLLALGIYLILQGEFDWLFPED